MAKGIYFGVNSLAKKIKKMYIGVGGVAHKVKKAYIGIAGKARVWFSGGELEYHGEISSLSVGRRNVVGAYNSNYALFGGGDPSGGNIVDAYNASLVRTTATPFDTNTYYHSGASIGSFALFAGGNKSISNVSAYNNELTKSNPTALSAGRRWMGVGINDSYAVFAGGRSGSATYHNTVDAYNNSLVRTNPTGLAVKRYNTAGAYNGEYIVFVGGSEEYAADAYNKSLTRVSAPTNKYKRSHPTGVGISRYALFVGGWNEYGVGDMVEAYDQSLTLTQPAKISYPFNMMSSTTTNSGDFAFLVGESSNYGFAYSIDSSLTVTNLKAITPREDLGVSKVGPYVLVGGGYTGSSYTNKVEAYIE